MFQCSVVKCCKGLECLGSGGPTLSCVDPTAPVHVKGRWHFWVTSSVALFALRPMNVFQINTFRWLRLFLLTNNLSNHGVEVRFGQSRSALAVTKFISGIFQGPQGCGRAARVDPDPTVNCVRFIVSCKVFSHPRPNIFVFVEVIKEVEIDTRIGIRSFKTPLTINCIVPMQKTSDP